MLTFGSMFRVLVGCCALTLTLSCSSEPQPVDPAAEWRAVLESRQAITEDPRTVQRWSDELHAFIRRHPDHARAREVWEALEIEHALRLGDHGRAAEGAERLRKLLANTPRDRHRLREALSVLENRADISADELSQVTRGSSSAEVESLLGAPPPGWRRSTGSQSETWYYRGEAGSTSAIHFHRGKVIAIDSAAAPGNQP